MGPAVYHYYSLCQHVNIARHQSCTQHKWTHGYYAKSPFARHIPPKDGLLRWEESHPLSIDRLIDWLMVPCDLLIHLGSKWAASAFPAQRKTTALSHKPRNENPPTYFEPHGETDVSHFRIRFFFFISVHFIFILAAVVVLFLKSKMKTVAWCCAVRFTEKIHSGRSTFTPSLYKVNLLLPRF